MWFIHQTEGFHGSILTVPKYWYYSYKCCLPREKVVMFEGRLSIRKFPPHLLHCNHCHGSTSPLPHTWTKEASMPGDINKVLWQVSMLTYHSIFFRCDHSLFSRHRVQLCRRARRQYKKARKSMKQGLDEPSIGGAIETSDPLEAER